MKVSKKKGKFLPPHCFCVDKTYEKNAILYYKIDESLTFGKKIP